MYPVSDAYIQAINQSTRKDRVTIEIFNRGSSTPKYTLENADIESGTLTVSRQCVNNGYFEWGAAYASEMQFHTRTTKINELFLIGKYCRLTYYLTLADGTEEAVPVGMYRITECDYTRGLWKITAYDCLVVLDREGVTWSVKSLISPYEMLQYALFGNYNANFAAGTEAIEVVLGNTKAEIEALPNGTVPMKLAANSMGTAREIISSVAELLGCYVEADKTEANKIWLRPFRTSYSRTVSADIRFSYEINLDWDRPRDIAAKINYVDDGGKTQTQYTAKGKNGVSITDFYQMNLDNKILSALGSTSAMKILDQLVLVLNQLNAKEYLPISFSFVGDPSMDPGDMILCEYNGTRNQMIIGGLVWNYRNAESITAIGGNKETDVSQAPSGQKNSPSASGSGSDSDTSSAQIRYSEYQNTESVFIGSGQEAAAIALRIVSYKATDVMFFAEITLQVETDETITDTEYICTDGKITAAYYVGGAEIGAFRPSWTLQDGTCTIHLAQHFAVSSVSALDFQVRISTSGCRVTIPAMHIHAVVEGAYLAGEEAWDGMITVSDTIEMAVSADSIRMAGLTDQAEIAEKEVQRQAITDTVRIAVTGSDTVVAGFTDAVQSEITEEAT